MSRKENLAKNTFIIALGTFFPKFAIFITLPILTSYLTKVEYGSYDLVLTIISLLVPIVTLQIQSAAFRFLLDIRDNNEKISEVITNIFMFIIPSTFLSSLVLFIFLNKFNLKIRIIICLYLIVAVFANSNIQIIRGLTHNKTYAIGSIISSIGQIILILLLVKLLGFGLSGSLIAISISELITSIYIFFRGKLYKYINLKLINSKQIKAMLSYSWAMVPNSLSQWIMHVSDRFVISIIIGVKANALYAVAYKFPSILSFAQTTFNMAWQENASIYSKDEDVEKYYSSMFETLFEIVAGSMALLIGVTPFLFNIFVNDNYRDAYTQIPILYMGILFFCLSSFWGGIFVAYKRTSIVASTSLISAFINLSIDILTMRRIGLYAASISTLVSYIVLCLLRMKGVKRFMNLEYNYKSIFLVFIFLIIQCVLSMKQIVSLDVVNFLFGTTIFFALNIKYIRLIISRIIEKIIN